MKPTLYACALIAGCLACGCAVSTEPDRRSVVVADDGLLTLDWSVDGTTDPDECDQSDAESIDVLITTDRGTSMGNFVQYCDEFVMSIELPPGSYEGNAVLLDSRDQTRTTAVDLGYFEIFGNDELSISVDFPASSFY